jgi:hypothetical protein
MDEEIGHLVDLNSRSRFTLKLSSGRSDRFKASSIGCSQLQSSTGFSSSR